MTSGWIGTDWIGRVIDGRFTLQRWLGAAGQSAVFLTQFDGNEPQQAAIKLIPAEAADAEACVAQWAAATHLSHPHLIRLLHAGVCRVDGLELLYTVTDYSEEILAEILPARPLSTAEIREMLDPVLGTLSWLHVQGLVHGGLKPSNIMVVGDKLKLSVDRVQPAGPHGTPFPTTGIYDAPGATDRISPAADVWSLGMLLVEAFTQKPAHWDRNSSEDPEIPQTLPQPFLKIASECLHVDPARRCTLTEVLSQLTPLPESEAGAKSTPPPSAKTGPQPIFRSTEPRPLPRVAPPAAPPVVAAPPAVKSAPAPLVPPVPVMVVPAKAGARRSVDESFTVFATAALILIAAIAAMTFIPIHHPAHPSKPQAGTSATAPATVPAPATGDSSATTLKGAVLDRVLPDVSQGAINTIHGNLRVEVRVRVDADGNVSDASFETRGPSRYFADRAQDAARKWKFHPAQVAGHPVPSTWILRFDFARNGTQITPQETAP